MKFAISDRTKSVRVPLESRPDIAAIVGNIVSQFAITESHAPTLLSLLTSMSAQDAKAIMGVFRAFSNRIDLIDAIAKTRPRDSWESIIASHFKGHFKEANRIRNKYAHATYASGEGIDLSLMPYFSHIPEKLLIESLTFASAKADFDKVVKINLDLENLLFFRKLPKALHAKLPRQAQG